MSKEFSRRKFIKGAALGVAGVSAASLGLLKLGTAAKAETVPAPAEEVESVEAITTPNVPVMFQNGIKLRWFNNAGFEIVLPSGRHILVDPWLDHAGYWTFPAEKVERCDFVILSHSHGDHAADCGTLQKRFGRYVLMCPEWGVEQIMLDMDLDIRNIYRVCDGRKYEFDDVIFEVFGSRHTESNSFSSFGSKTENAGFKDFKLEADYGTYDVVNYLITSKLDGTKILIWAGMTTEDQKYALKDTHADIAIVHISPKQNMDLMGQMVAQWGPRVVMPHHYDIWDTKGGISWAMHQRSVSPEQAARYLPATDPGTPESGFNTALYMADQGAAIKRHAPNATFLMIEHQKWYKFSTCYELLDE